MSIDGFLSFLSLVVAVYALLPSRRRLEIGLSLSRADYSIIACVFISILYLHFYSFFNYIGWTVNFSMSSRGIDTNKAAYLVSILAFVIFYFRIKNRPLNRDSIFKFRDLVDELIVDKQWATLFKLIEKRVSEVFVINNANFFWNHLKLRFRPQDDNTLSHLTAPELSKLLSDLADGVSVQVRKPPRWQRIKNFFSRVWLPLYWFFDTVLPDYKKAQECASEVVEEIFLSREVVSEIANNRPYLMCRVISFPFNEKRDFVDLYLRAMIENHKSSLYKEVQRSQDSSVDNQHIFHERNRILKSLIGNSKNAVDLQVWKPLGESAIKYLDYLFEDRSDPYDLNPIRFEYSDTERMDCPVQNVICIFDLMVNAAFFDDVEWHMWLYYFDHFVQKMIRNMGDHSRSESDKTSRYHYLIEDMIWKMTAWVRLIEFASVNQENVKLKKIDSEHENGNIPKSSLVCLGHMLLNINSSEKLSDEFKVSCTDSLYHLYFNIKQRIGNNDYAEIIAMTIKNGGYSGYGISGAGFQEHKRILDLAFTNFDTIPYLGGGSDVNEFKTKIGL